MENGQQLSKDKFRTQDALFLLLHHIQTMKNYEVRQVNVNEDCNSHGNQCEVPMPQQHQFGQINQSNDDLKSDRKVNHTKASYIGIMEEEANG
jgi:hypothetical protein